MKTLPYSGDYFTLFKYKPTKQQQEQFRKNKNNFKKKIKRQKQKSLKQSEKAKLNKGERNYGAGNSEVKLKDGQEITINVTEKETNESLNTTPNIDRNIVHYDLNVFS